MRTAITSLSLVLLLCAVGGDALAQEQSTPMREGTIPVEFSDKLDTGNPGVTGDKQANFPGGPLSTDAEQVLYTQPPDSRGPLFPVDTIDFGGSGQVDALANWGDAYFQALANDGVAEPAAADQVDLLVSFDGDPGGPMAVYQEDAAPPPFTTRGLWTQNDHYFEDGIFPAPDDIDDLDAIELYGPMATGDPPPPISGWDANLFSLEGDPGGTSVWFYPAGGPAVAYITQAQIHAAVASLGFSGSIGDIDLDALMAREANFDGVWNSGDRIFFSIKATSGWDGGEIVDLTNTGGGGFAASFLDHGGHFWDTAFLVGANFGVETEEVDAIEAGIDIPSEFDPRHNYWVVQQRYHNNTGETAYDLTKIIRGPVYVRGAIHHKFPNHVVINLFGFTIIHWYGGTVEHCEWTWACFWGSGYPKPRVLAAFWTRDDGSIIGRAGPALGMAGYVARDPELGDYVRVDVTHDWCEWDGAGYPVEAGDGCVGALPAVSLSEVYYAITNVRRPMQQLNETLYDDAQLDWIPLGDAAVSYGEAETFDLGPAADINPPYNVVLFRYHATADVEGTVYESDEILEFLVDPPAIPAVSEWGVVAMVLLVLAAGTIVFRKFKAAAA